MKHFVFPSKQQADAFIEDLRSQNLIQSEIGHASFARRTPVAASAATTTTHTETVEVTDGGGDTGEMAGGAVKGGALGALAGLAAGAVVAATGGLAAVPVILGASIGSVAGMASGAVNGDGMNDTSVAHVQGKTYHLEDEHYDRLHTAVGTEGTAVAVEDNVDAAAVSAAAARHGGQQVA